MGILWTEPVAVSRASARSGDDGRAGYPSVLSSFSTDSDATISSSWRDSVLRLDRRFLRGTPKRSGSHDGRSRVIACQSRAFFAFKTVYALTGACCGSLQQ